MASHFNLNKQPQLDIDDDDDDLEIDDSQETWDDWNADENADDDDSQLKCLFCDLNLSSLNSFLEHCSSAHCFDFTHLKKSLGLDFYGCFKLINYVRAMVAQNTCWSCGHRCNSNQELLCHLHEASISEGLKLLWDDDKYLQPYMEGDALLFSFDEDFDEDECMPSVDEGELVRVFGDARVAGLDDEMVVDSGAWSALVSGSGEKQELASNSNGCAPVANSCTEEISNGVCDRRGFSDIEKKDRSLRSSFANVAASEIKKVNEGYFGSYSSFGIHREMLSDKIRTDAYQQAIMKNPTLLNGAAVLDVGCGTGILSLFAAKAGASRVIAVDASEKMASVATKIAKDNGLLCGENTERGNGQPAGVIEVVHGMIEDLDKSILIEPHSIDILVSEWMGYCLLYETMLSSVLYARDRWLKPGGAILPDTATMFAAGFGRGCTSLPFWENVYGFNMSSVGNELVKDAAEFPIVDVVDSNDIITETAVLKNFDLATMTAEMMDFTSSIELQSKSCKTTKPTWCYGIVLWFDTGFTSRFCKEMPANLSTSPYIPKTHWSQTILTFKEPVLLSSSETCNVNSCALIGTDSCPASKIQLRISIVRAPEHRAIDISVETCGVAHDGRKRAWPVQIFNLA
ncbi:hypothetical protein RND81_10G053500 [Saponaria officinalis]|uniref:type I protein arginine methyltransferase n=1 Tax=Saponaria officinalis TaxID=3572 RepID=A0AAW1HY09_SAPOF